MRVEQKRDVTGMGSKLSKYAAVGNDRLYQQRPSSLSSVGDRGADEAAIGQLIAYHLLPPFVLDAAEPKRRINPLKDR